MNDHDFLQKLFAGGNSYWLTRFIILRLLGFVYAVAFFVAAQQLVSLIGGHGLTPARYFLGEIHSQLGSRTAGMLQVPTLFWFGISDKPNPTQAKIDNPLSEIPNQNNVGTCSMPAVREPSCE